MINVSFLAGPRTGSPGHEPTPMIGSFGEAQLRSWKAACTGSSVTATSCADSITIGKVFVSDLEEILQPMGGRFKRPVRQGLIEWSEGG